MANQQNQNNKHIPWRTEYELGQEDIDFQHHFFLNLINRMYDELHNTENQKFRSQLIAELNAYAKFHFISEENIMFKAGYPALEQHRQHHRQLIDQLSAKGLMLLKRGSDKESKEIIDFLTDWFLHHTMTEDKNFVHFLNKKQSV